MNFLRNLLKNFLYPKNKEVAVVSSSVGISCSDQQSYTKLKIFHASGGKIVETEHYDHVKDRYATQLYIITDVDNLGSELEKILTIEALKR
jgi:hypothetical protein